MEESFKALKVTHVSITKLPLDILNQLLRLNIGNDGLMRKPIRDAICLKKGIHVPEHIKNQLNNSFVALINLNEEIICWGLILSQTESIVREMCMTHLVEYNNQKYEFHIFTKKKYRKLGLATKLSKSVKRKYGKTQYFSYWAESSIFCRIGLMHLAQKDIEIERKTKSGKFRSC